MHKLVILIQATDNQDRVEENWPEFLHQAENMPGLIKESTSNIEHFLYGDNNYIKMHELFFNSSQEVQQAMASPQGRAAGAILQRITSGKLILFIADHREDSIENIRKYSTWIDATNET